MATVPLWLNLFVEAAAKDDRRSVGSVMVLAMIDHVFEMPLKKAIKIGSQVTKTIRALEPEQRIGVVRPWVEAVLESDWDLHSQAKILDAKVGPTGFENAWWSSEADWTH